MPWIGPAIGATGSLLSGAFGGAKDPGPSSVLQNSRADALTQSQRYLDAFYGSNWRQAQGPSYGQNGAYQQINGDSNSGNLTSNYNYTPGGRSGSGGQSAAAAGGSGGYGGVGNPQLAGGNTPFGNAPILQQIQGASNAGIGENAGVLNNFNQGAEQGYRTAQNFGTGQNAVIESDAAKSLKDANAASLARLNGMGLGGSTIATDEMGANSAGNFRELARAKANLADQATGLKLNQINSATSGRAALQQSLNASNQNLRMNPINAQINTLGNSVVNPFAVGGGQAPGVAQNSTLGSLGNSLSQFGGLYTANNLYNQNNPNPGALYSQMQGAYAFNGPGYGQAGGAMGPPN
jgi:hypothetical protein